MTASRWTTQQVLALAPDANSVSAARRLTSLRTWSDLGCNDSLVWGKCQGSGRSPYQVTVDLTEPAFKCTCPSRKFPCKHGLALLLLWVEHGDAVADAAATAHFARDWAEQRAESSARKAARAGRDPADIVDPEGQARRQANREAAMSAGLDELERWLGDVVRQGLAGARRQPYRFWDDMAARLVDAQLPGLADRVRATGGAVVARPDWADHLLAECGRWHLAIQAWRRREVLDEAALGDLRVFFGWSRRADEAAAFAKVQDRWVVAGVRQGDDGRILSQRTWLWGQHTGRWTVVLDFAAAGAALRVAQPVGTVVDDEVTLYPGSDPTRATLSGAQAIVAGGAVPAATTVAGAIDQVATWLAANPWRDRLPVVVAGAVLVDDGGRWWLQDPAGDRLPLARAADPWLLLALSGGAPATVAAEWDAGAAHPLAVTAGRAELVAL
jgi:hypothetical protein